MKKFVKILSFLLALVFTLSLFTACGEDPEVVEVSEKVTIQWVWGQKVLKEEVVEKGTKLESWTPDVGGGREFQGWYERPYIKKFDFDKAVTKSMIIYASFTGGEDSGSGSATSVEKVYVVLDSTWNDGSVLAAWAWPGDGWLSAMPTEDPNVFEFEIPEGATNMLFVNFSMEATEPNWDFQNMKTPDLGIPKTGNDKIYFHVSNNSWSNSSTEPGEAGDTGMGGATGPVEIIFIGTLTGWATDNSDSAYALTKGEDGVWRGTLTLTQAEELKLYDKGGVNGSNGWIASPLGTGENGNLQLGAGTYHFKFTEGDSGFIFWADGEEEPAELPSGGSTGGNGGSYDGETIRIYFKNNWSWPQVNCHWWGSAAGESSWPGDVMNKVNGTDDMYYLDVPADITGLLFNGQGGYGEDKSEDVTTGIFNGAAWEMNWDDSTQKKTAVPITYAP